MHCARISSYSKMEEMKARLYSLTRNVINSRLAGDLGGWNAGIWFLRLQDLNRYDRCGGLNTLRNGHRNFDYKNNNHGCEWRGYKKKYEASSCNNYLIFTRGAHWFASVSILAPSYYGRQSCPNGFLHWCLQLAPLAHRHWMAAPRITSSGRDCFYSFKPRISL